MVRLVLYGGRLVSFSLQTGSTPGKSGKLNEKQKFELLFFGLCSQVNRQNEQKVESSEGKVDVLPLRFLQLET